MDVNWKDSIDQILHIFENGIECEINKSMSAFEALSPLRDSTFVTCFFDILNNRMGEACRKVQMQYLAAMQYIRTDELHETGATLISVTSIPTVESDLSDLSTMENKSPSEDCPIDESNEVQTDSANTLIPAADDDVLGESTPTNESDLSNNHTASMDISSIDTESAGSISEIERVPSIENTATAEVFGCAEDVTVKPKSSIATTVSQVEVDSFSGQSSILSNIETASAEQTSSDLTVFSEIELAVQSNLAKSSPSMETENITTSADSVVQPMHAISCLTTGIENNSLKRKEVTEKEISEYLIKKRRTMEEMPSAEVLTSPAQEFNEKTVQLMAIPKNNDPKVHCQNATYRAKCLLCAKTDSDMVRHYAVMHPESDVFIARPRPAIVERIWRKNGFSIFKDGQIQAFCFFCESPFTKTHDEWKMHWLSHTGESEYYCAECRCQFGEKVKHENCSIERMSSIFADCDAGAVIEARMCKWCNYIQMHKSRMVRHLEHEHSTIESNFAKNIEKVILIPDLRPLTWTLSSQYKFVKDENRFRCSEKCCAEFINQKEFENHFKNSHNDELSFECPHCHESIDGQNRRLIIDVVKHYRSHGRHLNECASCEMQFDTDFTTINHIVRCHPTENIVYRQIYRTSDCAVDKKECTIWLQCNVCSIHMESAAKSTDHFLKAHKSHYFDFKAMKLVKRTIVDNNVTTSKKSKNDILCRRWLMCPLCSQSIKTKDALIEHFNSEHRMQGIAMKLGSIYARDQYPIESAMQSTFDNNLVFYCVACRDTAATAPESNSLAYGSVESVHNHWMRSHSMQPDPKPFHFYAVEFVLCTHCKYISSFDEVKNHHKENHPGELLAVARVYNQKLCALCDYVGDDLGQHLKTEHELVLRMDSFNPTRFDEDTLNKLLKIDVHMKFKCDHCENVFETMDQIKNHSSAEHTVSMKYTHFFDNQSIKIIAGCCQATLDLHTFLDHLADSNHQFPGVCSKCNFKSTQLFEFVNHQVIAHQIAKNPDALYRRLFQTRFWSTKVLFGSGLILNKHNLLGTEVDDSKPFEDLTEHLLSVAHARLSPIDY